MTVDNQDLHIPPLRMANGPQGFRAPRHPGTTTQWPCALGMAASWDRQLVRRWGEAMGREFVGKGANVQLAPGLNVARVPRNGRNFEYLSGEDPYLGAELVGPVVQGIQSCGVIANAKHYLMNNQVCVHVHRTHSAASLAVHPWYVMPLTTAAHPPGPVPQGSF